MTQQNHTILIVDDENDILEFVEYNLLKDGYTVVKARNGEEAVQQAKKYRPSLILLDIMMPGMDGVQVCAKLRTKKKFSKTIIAFLTARNDEETQIKGLDAGGDDYISKPIKPRILMSKVASLLRRVEDHEKDEKIIIGEFLIDKQTYRIYKDNEKIKLPRKEFELLYLLASKPDKVFSREEIYNKIWGSNIIVGKRTIDVHIRKIREKIGDNYIQTLKGVGYKMVV